MCSEDSNCLGVEFQETATGEVRCFKMNNDSSADAVLQDDLGLVYRKGIFLNNLEDMFCAVNFNFRKKNSTTDTFSDSRGRRNGESCWNFVFITIYKDRQSDGMLPHFGRPSYLGRCWGCLSESGCAGASCIVWDRRGKRLWRCDKVSWINFCRIQFRTVICYTIRKTNIMRSKVRATKVTRWQQKQIYVNEHKQRDYRLFSCSNPQ